MRFSHDQNYGYSSRRSVVISPGGAVATSQPLATEIGVEILRAGGTAADAAVAAAAALQVTQPCSTGLGGDAFCLYYDADSGEVSAYNGSGRSPSALTLELARTVAAAESGEESELPDYHAHTVTVPGAADAWEAVHTRFGTLPLSRVLAPAAALAEGGFSVEPMTSRWWEAGAVRQLADRRFGHELMIDGHAPRVGTRFRNPGLARVLREFGAEGSELFYKGWIGEHLVREITHEGGVMTATDLSSHTGEWVSPIRIPYGEFDVWECPPNGQGLAALLALQTYDQIRPECSSAAERVHAQIEAMRLGFADAARHVADPDFRPAPLDGLLSREYATKRAAEISLERRMESASVGISVGETGSDTVYFSVVDEHGNGCSFINSNFMGFGTGIVPEGCGFTLQNRGRGFVLEEGHANALAPSKRPYHTIIPGLITYRTGALAAVFGVMGGMMQPQGHLQVVAALIDQQVDPQTALDTPRWQIEDGSPDGAIQVEESMDRSIVEGLDGRGHNVLTVRGAARAVFGLGQVIAAGEDQLLWCGSDPRGDGNAAPAFRPPDF